MTGEVRRIKIKCFDTLPIASSLCILKNGFLFVATESGNHHFINLKSLAMTIQSLQSPATMFLSTLALLTSLPTSTHVL